MIIPGIESSRDRLKWLVKRLKSHNLQVIATELTPDEFKPYGLRAVRVIIPQLMPISYHYYSRFLEHPRLHNYAAYLGKKNFSNKDVNPYPQPFA